MIKFGQAKRRGILTILRRNPVLLYEFERLNTRQRFDQKYFDINWNKNPHEGWEWHRLLNYINRNNLIHRDRENINSKNEFIKYLNIIEKKNKKRCYLFGTGPSLSKAFDRKWDDGYKVVCNTIVKDKKLWNYLNPEFVVAGDAIYHFGFTKFAEKFRSDLKKRLRETKTLFVYPDVFDLFVKREFIEFINRLIPIPIGDSNRVDVDLSDNFFLPGLGNVLPLLLLPLGTTLSKNIYMWGFDGRAPKDKLFWKNSNKHTYPKLISSIQEAHPAFFNYYAPKSNPSKYIHLFHGDILDEQMKVAENRGFKYIMMHKSWTDTLQKRYQKSTQN